MDYWHKKPFNCASLTGPQYALVGKCYLLTGPKHNGQRAISASAPIITVFILLAHNAQCHPACETGRLKARGPESSEPTTLIPRQDLPVSSALLMTSVKFAHVEAPCMAGMLIHP
jgi:hypothetical protein